MQFVEYKRRPLDAPYFCCATLKKQSKKCSYAPRFKCDDKWFCKLHIPKCTTILEQSNCSICLEKCDSKKTKCNHIFHAKCIYVWLQKHHTCPVCRFALKDPYPSETNQFNYFSELVNLRVEIGFSENAFQYPSGYVEIDPFQTKLSINSKDVESMVIENRYNWASNQRLVDIMKHEYTNLWYHMVNTTLWDAHHIVFDDGDTEEVDDLRDHQAMLHDKLQPFYHKYNICI